MSEPAIHTGKRGRPQYVARIGRRDYMRELMRKKRAKAKAAQHRGMER